MEGLNSIMNKIAEYLKDKMPENLKKKRELEKKLETFYASLYASGYPEFSHDMAIRKQIRKITSNWDRHVTMETLNTVNELLEKLPSEQTLKRYQKKHIDNLMSLDLKNKSKEEIIAVLNKNKMLQQLIDITGVAKEYFIKDFAEMYLNKNNLKQIISDIAKKYEILGFSYLNKPYKSLIQK